MRTEFTLAYVEGKLDEHKLLDETEMIEIEPRKKFNIGPFKIEPIRVTHSLVDCVALAIETPVGIIIHTGDFKIDLSPIDGHAFDLHTFAEYGKRGVLALLQDSTNVERSGYTPSERAVIPRLDEVFSQTKKKLFFTLLLFLDLPHSDCPRAGAEASAQGCGRGPVDDGVDRDCAGPGLHRCSERPDYSSRADARFSSGTADDSDQRNAGRADVGAEPRRRG